MQPDCATDLLEQQDGKHARQLHQHNSDGPFGIHGSVQTHQKLGSIFSASSGENVLANLAKEPSAPSPCDSACTPNPAECTHMSEPEGQ